MDFTDKKFEIAIVTMAVVMVGGFGYLFKSSGAAKLITQDVVYEMPRPKSFVGSDFDLSDRDIDRQYKNPFDKKNKDDAARAVNAQGTQPAAKADDKKKQAAAKKSEEKKKPKVDINVVEGSDNRMSDDGGLTSSPNSYGQTGGQVAGGEISQPKKEEKDKDKLSPGQWRSLIASEPTQANVSKLIQAYSAGEIDEASYLAIVGDLFASNKSESQALGIYAVNYVYSPRAFGMVTTNMDKLDSTNKAQAEGYLMAYTKGSRLNLLASALQSSSAAVVTKAAQVVIAGYEQAKSGSPTSTDPRDGRGNSGTSTSLAAYSRFVPIFQSLAQSNDAGIANLANSALGQLQTVVASI
ncbi:hypothetical protein D3C72_857770 [compost metagenome]